jgi:imidazole glycerol-phosphate synthase subunit HisH
LKVGIIDTGICNSSSLEYGFSKLGISTGIISSGEDLGEYDRFVLPGVGAFDSAVQKLHERKLWDFILKKIVDEKKPILGICLGMQLFAESSEEGVLSGLGIIKGKVLKISPINNFRGPSVGWNYVEPKQTKFVERYRDKVTLPRFYFVHSYHFDCANPEDISMQVILDQPYCAAVAYKNIWGVQFHPEKSHNYGLDFLKFWLEA